MHVMPFWSYRPSGGGVVITNWVTGETLWTPARLVDLLEDVYSGRGPSDMFSEDAPLLREADALGLILESRDAADARLAAHEKLWQVDVPAIDQIELTNRCPYSCKMCPRTTSMDRALGDMPLDLFETIIRQISGRQRYVGLHHFGESLLHPGLPEAISAARAAGIATGLSCNPPSLHPALAQRLLEAGIADIVLSLDSLRADTYRDIRGIVARLDRADSHVRALVRLRDAGRFETSITAQMIEMRSNRDEGDRFLEYCREVGVDRGVVIRLGRWDFEDSYVEDLGEPTSPGYNLWCSRPWTSVVVLWDGRVVPCCHDYNGSVVLGDLKTHTLDEIWSSPTARRFRDDNGNQDICRRCAFSRVFRERAREKEGFRRFHRERGAGGARKEWINPGSHAARARLFDGFDVEVTEPDAQAAPASRS